MRLVAAAAIAAFSMFALGTEQQSSCAATICVGDSWQAAYLAADTSVGDVVLTLESGSHPSQSLARDPSKDGQVGRVIFQPLAGPVTLGALSSGIAGGSVASATGAAHWELRDVTVTGEVAARWGSNDVRLVDVDAGNLRLTSVSDVTVLGGDYGPWTNQVATINRSGNGAPGPSSILVDGAAFHDYTIDDPAKHAECLQIWPAGGFGIVVRNSVFQNCTDFDVLVKGSGLSGVVFENNFFDVPMPGAVATVSCNPDCPRGGTSLRFSTYTYPGSLVRYNTALGGITIDCGCVPKIGNLQDPTQVVDSSPRDGTMDLHLRAGAAAIDAGDTASSPATDIDGDTRPQGAAADLGADEVPALDSIAPSAPGVLTIADPTATSAVLSWSSSSDAVGVIGYRVYRDGALVMDTTELSVLVTGLEAESHLLEAEAYDAAGNVSPRSALTIRRTWEA